MLRRGPREIMESLMVIVSASLRWLALRLGRLLSILALTLLAPLLLFYTLVPAGWREKMSRYVAACLRFRVPVLSRVMKTEA